MLGSRLTFWPSVSNNFKNMSVGNDCVTADRAHHLQSYATHFLLDALLKIPRVTSNSAFLEFMEVRNAKSLTCPYQLFQVDQHVDPTHMSMMPNAPHGISDNQSEEDGLAWEQARQQKIVSNVARQFINISQQVGVLLMHFTY